MGHRAGQVGDAVVVGIVGVLWYALPDVVESRRARALLKAALLVGGGAYAWWRDESAAASDGVASDGAAAREASQALPGAPSPGSIAAHVARGPAVSPAALGLPVDADGRFSTGSDRSALRYAAAAAGIIVPVLVESAVHRCGVGLAARGVRAPHTRVALVMGPLGAVATSLSQARRTRP